MRAVALAGHGVASWRFANIHAARVMPKAGRRNMPAQMLWHYNRVFGDFKRKNAGFGGVMGEGIWGGVLKMGQVALGNEGKARVCKMPRKPIAKTEVSSGILHTLVCPEGKRKLSMLH